MQCYGLILERTLINLRHDKSTSVKALIAVGPRILLLLFSNGIGQVISIAYRRVFRQGVRCRA